jgi:hypothetical protein
MRAWLTCYLELMEKAEKQAFRLSPALLRKLDDLRRDEADLPTRGAMVRRLIEEASLRKEEAAKWRLSRELALAEAEGRMVTPSEMMRRLIERAELKSKETATKPRTKK